MNSGMILGITPARGGSKGLPMKNIRMCAGKPLLAWTIEAVLGSELLDRYIVSTDSPEVAAVAQEQGVAVHSRPPLLAADDVNRWDVLKYHISEFPEASIIVLLQATSPIRRPGLIDECIREFLDTGCDSLATGYYFHGVPYPENRGQNRQILGTKFFDNGNVYIWKRELIEQNMKQHAGNHYRMKELTRQEDIDINTENDLVIAEGLLLRGAV